MFVSLVKLELEDQIYTVLKNTCTSEKKMHQVKKIPGVLGSFNFLFFLAFAY